jgi:hypothetical protein
MGMVAAAVRDLFVPGAKKRDSVLAAEILWPRNSEVGTAKTHFSMASPLTAKKSGKKFVQVVKVRFPVWRSHSVIIHVWKRTF